MVLTTPWVIWSKFLVWQLYIENDPRVGTTNKYSCYVYTYLLNGYTSASTAASSIHRPWNCCETEVTGGFVVLQVQIDIDKFLAIFGVQTARNSSILICNWTLCTQKSYPEGDRELITPQCLQ